MSDFLDSETNRLLIVDDELSVREILAEGLASFGYDARPVGNVAEAMESIRNDPPHLVLTDIEMPGESGLDLLRQVKTLHPELDVVMVTGVVDARTAIGAIRDGASDYLTKPFNLDEVQIVVERTLEKRRLVLENRRYQDHLEDLVRARTAELEEKGAELQELYVTTLQALVTALDYRDNETQGHSLRVVEYAVLVAEAMDIREPDLTWIRRGALLHDVGKIGITDSVLRKPGKLDDDEWEEMHKHPEMGFRMLQKIPFLGP
ncbi:MAG: response regulator, partial [Acidobacteriota bacterium]|nr:response regulator [Acidobacteriota bacterium]